MLPKLTDGWCETKLASESCWSLGNDLSEAPCNALCLKENARPEHKQPVKRLIHEPAKVTLVQRQQDIGPRQRAEQNGSVFGVEKQPHLPSRNRCISASSCAIHPAICSGANLRGSGSLARLAPANGSPGTTTVPASVPASGHRLRLRFRQACSSRNRTTAPSRRQRVFR